MFIYILCHFCHFVFDVSFLPPLLHTSLLRSFTILYFRFFFISDSIVELLHEINTKWDRLETIKSHSFLCILLNFIFYAHFMSKS